MTEAEQDAAITAVLPHVPRFGWTMAAARAGGAEALFPRGAADLLDGFAAWADRRMAEAAERADMAALRTAARVRAVILLRLALLRPHREAVRRAVGHPMRCQARARSLDAIWHAAGERLEGPSRHSKRLLLGAVYAATLLVWLREAEAGEAATADFLDRRLADVRRIGDIRTRVGNFFLRRPSLYPAHARIRKSFGEMMRKLSVTSSQ